MARYRKKPVIIEAVLWLGTKLEPPVPDWIRPALEAQSGPGAIIRVGNQAIIGTLEGDMAANPGDYIIRGVKGELYPCKPDIFAATYELVEEGP